MLHVIGIDENNIVWIMGPHEIVLHVIPVMNKTVLGITINTISDACSIIYSLVHMLVFERR